MLSEKPHYSNTRFSNQRHFICICGITTSYLLSEQWNSKMYSWSRPKLINLGLFFQMNQRRWTWVYMSIALIPSVNSPWWVAFYTDMLVPSIPFPVIRGCGADYLRTNDFLIIKHTVKTLLQKSKITQCNYAKSR